ncbi:MAG: PEP-CTERM sorting domain-containing protein [Acidobacteriota bacterium]
MKNLLITFVLLITATMAAQSATISFNCGLSGISNIYNSSGGLLYGNATNTGPNFSLAGNTLSGATISYGLDYSYSLAGTPPINVSMTFDPAGSGWSSDPVLVTKSGNGAITNPQSPNPAFSSIVLNVADFFAGPTVTLTPGSFSGGAESVTASVIITYTYDTTPTQGEIPEPSSFALLGTGLLGFVAYARRRYC